MKQFFPSRLIAAAMLGAALLNPDMTEAQKKVQAKQKSKPAAAKGSQPEAFKLQAESFADIELLRYKVPGFNELTLQQKRLAYYLYEAALCGRDMIYDQRSRNGLLIRKTLEAMYASYTGPRKGADWEAFKTYCGRFWFSNGYHHHYGNEKFIPECPPHYFHEVLRNSNAKLLPLKDGMKADGLWGRLMPLIYDPGVEPKLVDQSPDVDNVQTSSVNFYEGVNQQEVEEFYSKFDTKGNAPSWGLNSKLIKENGEIREKVWKSGGMYGASIQKIIDWLEKAANVAENNQQALALRLLITFYQTGDLKVFDEYSVAWVQDVNSRIDVVNGFIEVYLDPIGKKGSFESIVSLKDIEATKRISAIAEQAQWFEDNSPLMPEHKKKVVTGITGKAITVIVESGDAAPSTPIGVNLPNADWIRKIGSKSVSLSNIISAYNTASAKGGMADEFAVNPEVLARMKKWGPLAADLHTDMHECIGHASGQINEGVETTDKTLKNYASTLEEARADLVALYYAMDQKLVDIGVTTSTEVGKAEYDSYMMNGLMTQLTRLKAGDKIEEAHMRNRALNAYWAYERGKADNVVAFVKKNGKTYVQVNDYEKLRVIFGELLREIQRIKSEGDFEAGKALVENYGVKVDPELHNEMLTRFATLGVKPYRGFIQPRLVPVMTGGQITDVKVEYPESFFDQMIEYGKKYAYLPVEN